MSSSQSSPLQTFRQARRRFVRERGKRITRGIKPWLGRQSLVGNPSVFDPELFPFLREMEVNWELIRKELDSVLAERERLPAFHEISPDNVNISDNRWKTFLFCGFGHRADKNCERCPETARLLDQIPGLKNAWFSILGPGVHVPHHKGITKGWIRVHLGLKIPKDRENCRMKVGDDMCFWDEGRVLVFDDTRRHEVWNDTDEERAVLLFDFERPMRPLAKIVARTFEAGLRRTGYAKEAIANYAEWADDFHAEETD